MGRFASERLVDTGLGDHRAGDLEHLLTP